MSDLGLQQKTAQGSSRLIFIPEHVPSSKNSRIRTPNGYIVPSKATQKWRRNTKHSWEKNKDNFTIQLGEYPIKVGFHFVRKTRHKYDWVNPLQTVLDEMVKHKWIPDDNIDIIVPIPLKWRGQYTTVDSTAPGVIIKIIK